MSSRHWIRHLPKLVHILLVISVYWTAMNNHIWTRSDIIEWDIISYYAYLPATFIHHDLSLEFTETDPDYYKDKFWPVKLKNGSKVIKTSMGMAIMYAPFFAIAHATAPMSGYDRSGFNAHYEFWLVMGSIFYFALALYFVRKLLQPYFSAGAIALTLLAISVGTNLYYYSTLEPAMPHLYSFMLLAAFLYVTVWFYKEPKLWKMAVFGAVFGLMTLTRPVNVLALLPFVLWGIWGVPNFKDRILFFLKKPQFVIVSLLAFFAVWAPQMVYWKWLTGHFLFSGYVNEQFFWADPKFMKVFFSYRKGWLVYTPIMSIALLGIPFLIGKYRQLFWPVAITFALYAYTISSWWCWWYGGGYGLRAFVDVYPLLVIPMAAFIQWLLQKGKLAGSIITIVVILFCGHNIFQMFQKKHTAIHWDSMTKEAYWDSFGRIKPSPDFDDKLQHPDYSGALKGKR